MTNERVSFPMFELVGDPCPKEGCEGVLIETVSIETKDYFKKCSECKGEFGKVPGEVMFARSVEMIEKLLSALPSDEEK